MDRGRLQGPVTFLVLRNDEYMILKWFAEFEQVGRCAGPRPPGPRHGRGGARLRDAGGDRTDREQLTEALRGAIAADDGPRLVEARVASGMWFE